MCHRIEMEYQAKIISIESGPRVADTLEEGEVIDELTGLLRMFTGDPGVPRPKRLHRRAWSTDPFSLGSASYPILATDSAGSYMY